MVSIGNEKATLDFYMLILFQNSDKFQIMLNYFLTLVCFHMDLDLIIFHQGVTDQTACIQ